MVHLPGLGESADCRVAHTHDDGKERVQILELPAAGESNINKFSERLKQRFRTINSPRSARIYRTSECLTVLRAQHSLSSDLDELLEQLNPFAELTTQTHLCHNPQLHLVEPDHDHTIPRGSNNTL